MISNNKSHNNGNKFYMCKFISIKTTSTLNGKNFENCEFRSDIKFRCNNVEFINCVFNCVESCFSWYCKNYKFDNCYFNFNKSAIFNETSILNDCKFSLDVSKIKIGSNVLNIEYSSLKNQRLNFNGRIFGTYPDSMY